MGGLAVGRVFERLGDAALRSPDRPAPELVHETVQAALAADLPGLGAAARVTLATRITQVLLDDPALRLRLERLMGAAL